LKKRSINFYDMEGKSVGKANIQFDWRGTQNVKVLTDDATGKFYLSTNNKAGGGILDELNINTGTYTSTRYAVRRPFIQNVKMHNGNVYFLWQDNHNGATAQLFVQRYD